MSKRPLAKLEPAVIQKLRKRVAEDRYTVDENWEFVKLEGTYVGRNSVWRFQRQAQAELRELRKMKEWAAAVGRDLHELAEADMNRLASDMLEAELLALIMRIKEQGDPDEEQLAMACQMHQRLTLARKRNVETEITIRVKTKAVKAVEAVAAQQGLSAATVELIRASILGIKEPHGASAGQA